jgi:hypothetical protein
MQMAWPLPSEGLEQSATKVADWLSKLDRYLVVEKETSETHKLAGAPPAPHVLYHGIRNPPVIDARSVYNKTQSLVEEDDD